MNALPSPPPLDLKHHALFLDFDGTLVDFASTPDGIVVPDRVLRILDALRKRTNGALAMVSGRGAENLAMHIQRRDILIAGGHGAEWLLDDAEVKALAGDPFDAEASIVTEYAAKDELLVVEHKLAGMTLHFRQAPQHGEVAKQVFKDTFGRRNDFKIMDGHMMVEARRTEADKGRAIERLMSMPQFLNRKPVFLGDDVTDEFGFAMVNGMRGISVRVGGGETIAGYGLKNIQAVLDWLEASLED